MSLPEQVRRRAERANELIAELKGPSSGDPAPTPPEPTAPPTPAPVEPPAPEPTPAPTAAPAPIPAPVVTDDPNSETWMHRYSTLQGVIQAEGRAAAERERALKERIAQLEAARPAPAPTPAPTPSATDFSQDEVDRFGPELLTLITRKAQSMAEQIVTAKMAEFTPALEQTQRRVDQVASTVYQTAEEKFWGELAKAVPDYARINTDPRWLKWLGEEDPVSGEARQEILNRHAGKLDHVRVGRIFDAFKLDAGITPPPAAPADVPAPVVPPISPSPRAVGNATAPTPREPGPATVKRSEISAHYRRSTTDPTYRASQEYAQMEQRIAQATQAGRVVEG